MSSIKDRIGQVADLLMSAAHADGHLEGEEKAAVIKLLREISGEASLPIDLTFQIEEWQSERFDLAATAAVFAKDPPETKRALLELIAAVHASDSEHDFAEDDHLREVAGVLGVPPEHYTHLTIEVLEEADLAEDLALVRAG